MRVVRRPASVEVHGDFRALSSAPWHGGYRRAHRIVNLRVPLSFDCDVPRFFRTLAAPYRRSDCVGLLTAVDVRTAAVERRTGVAAVATAGVTNSSTVGTINTIVVLRGRPSLAAMVEAVKVVTEAKGAVLRDLDVRSGSRPATGTSTDAVVIAAEDYGPEFVYCGPATAIGRSIGTAVYRAIAVGLRRQAGLRPDRPVRDRLVERGLSTEEIAGLEPLGAVRDAAMWESAFALDDAVLAGRLKGGPSGGYVRAWVQSPRATVRVHDPDPKRAGDKEPRRRVRRPRSSSDPRP